MADNQKYYYMRLKENFFEEDAIKIIESMPDGYLYSNILLKLYLKSLKFNGKLMFNERIPYNPAVLATITHHQVGTVEKAIELFKELDLIEVLDNGAIFMLDIQNFIGKSNTEADRKREYRARIKSEKQKLLEGGQMSGQCPPEIEKERKKEKERDLKVEEEKEASPEESDSDNSDNSDSESTSENEVNSEDVLQCFKGGVMLTDNQIGELLDEIGLEAFDYYVAKLGAWIEKKGFFIKNHYETIRKWHAEDAGIVYKPKGG